MAGVGRVPQDLRGFPLLPLPALFPLFPTPYFSCCGHSAAIVVIPPILPTAVPAFIAAIVVIPPILSTAVPAFTSAIVVIPPILPTAATAFIADIAATLPILAIPPILITVAAGRLRLAPAGAPEGAGTAYKIVHAHCEHRAYVRTSYGVRWWSAVVIMTAVGTVAAIQEWEEWWRW